MKKGLYRKELKLYYIDHNDNKILGKNPDMTGNCSGLSGNCSGLSGNCSGLKGDLSKCEITHDDRQNGVDIMDLVE